MSNTLQTYAYPVFGNLSLSDLNTDLVLKAVEPIWTSKAETASRVRQSIETVWDWARARDYVEGENPARLRGHLDKILANTAKIKRVEHYATLPRNHPYSVRTGHPIYSFCLIGGYSNKFEGVDNTELIHRLELSENLMEKSQY
ncbi:hypothetical protein OAI36_01765 [Alphaproteobacteria bacterium]|nr:hypothetical protein [Alphaproteobacteria bacterium]